MQLTWVIGLYIINADLLKQLNVQSGYQQNNDAISVIVAWYSKTTNLCLSPLLIICRVCEL